MFSLAFWEDLPDNVRVNEEINTYRVIAREGKPWQIKSETKQVFEAIRSDYNVMATTYYNDNISIDKASAPGHNRYTNNGYRQRGINNVTLHNVSVGKDVYINSVSNYIANYDIATML